MAIKCHSSFVHYNMFHNNHCHGGGNNYGSIFNITNNCGGGTSFWGGLGAGLGFGLGNMFGGMFGNMFGGFGNFGMGGFGLGNFGFGGWGNGMSGLWGNGWGGGNAGGANNDYSKYSSNKSTCNCKCGDGKCDDKDYDKINDLHSKANALCKNPKSPTNDKAIDDLIADLNKLKGELDPAHKAENEKQIDNIIKQLNDAKSGNPVTPAQNGQTPTTPTTPAVKPGDIRDLLALENLTPEQIDKLSAGDAKEILTNLGYLDSDGIGKMSANYKVLLLFQKAGVNVKCVQGTAQDPLIAGKISNVQLDGNNKVSYDIDASSYPKAKYGYKYSFKQGDDVNGKKAFHILNVAKNDSPALGGYKLDNLENENFLFQGERMPLSGCGNDVIKWNKDSNHKQKVQ